MAKRFLSKKDIITYLKQHSYLPKEGIERFAEMFQNKVSISDIRLRMVLNGWKWHLNVDRKFRDAEDRQYSIQF